MKTVLIGLWLAHSWYPLECCNDRDCHPVSSIEEVEGGYRAEGVFYPSAVVKQSPDGQAHACYVPSTRKALCLFIPFAM